MFDFQLSHLTQEQFDKVVEIILKYRNVYATTKLDVGKTKVKLAKLTINNSKNIDNDIIFFQNTNK